MGCGEEILALAFPGHDDREQARKGVRPALRATAEGGLAGHNRTAQRAFRRIIGWVDRRVDQPDNQVIQIFLDSFGQLLALPGAPVLGRKAPEGCTRRNICIANAPIVRTGQNQKSSQ